MHVPAFRMMMCVVACGAITSTMHSASLSDVLSRTVIVQATVEASEPAEHGGLISKQVVRHVYCGDIEVGTVFLERSSTTDRGMQGGMTFPPLAVGQEGLWRLRPSPHEDGQFARYAYSSLGVWWPVRRGIDAGTPFAQETPGTAEDEKLAREALFDRVLQLAEALEKVWRSPAESERIELLKRYSMSDTAEVAVGCITILGEGSPHSLYAFAFQTEVNELPITAQTAIDELLMRFSRDEWKQQGRQQLLRSWQDSVSRGDEDAISILQYLSQAAQRMEIDGCELFELLKDAAASNTTATDIRVRAAGLLCDVVSDSAVGASAFDLLAEILESGSATALEETSAFAISPVEKLNDERMAKLILLRDAYQEKALQIDDKRDPVKRIAATLDETVRRLQTPKRPG